MSASPSNRIPSPPSGKTPSERSVADLSSHPGISSRIRWLWKQKATRIGCLITALIGVLLIWGGGGVLERLSYDVLCLFQKGVPSELVMVRIDAEVKRNLNQPTDQPLNRRFYAQLLDRLRQDGAKLVFYDLLLDEPSADAGDDAAFGEAMRRHGRVVLIEKDFDQRQRDVITAGIIQPIPVLRESAAGCGLARIDYEPGRMVRRLYPGADSEPSAGWVAASLLDVPITRTPQLRLQPRWINYYCLPAQLRTVNFDQVLSPDGPTNGYFRDKIVVVGRFDDPLDIFQTPHSRFASGMVSDGPVTPGATIHAFKLLNLLRSDWLTRLPMFSEMGIVIAWGIIVTMFLMLLRPWPAICAALALGLLFTACSILAAQQQHVWFPWAIPVAAQTPFALVWAVGFESVRRRRLRRAFGLYLSPYMADRIANSDFDPSLGGKEVEATVMFTDLEGFTKLVESLSPTSASNILITYFNQTTRVIRDLDGTLIRYTGDGIMAAWGAPLPDPKHAEHTVQAALAMNRASQKEVEGRRLRTRIGINTGKFLAGNLGSNFRFDYTLLGDSTNFASRLEGLNKYLGTEILISDATRGHLQSEVKLRNVGRFIFAGTTKPASIHEVLGADTEFETEPPWLKSFSLALEHFSKGEFEAAETLFRKTVEARQGYDGPSEFYLRRIEIARQSPPSDMPWDGTVRLAEK